MTSGAATVTLPITMNTASTPACWPPGSPVCAMDVAAPLLHREQQERRPEGELDGSSGRRRAAAAGHPGRIGDDKHDPADHDEPEYPASHERRPVAARPGRDEHEDDRD